MVNKGKILEIAPEWATHYSISKDFNTVTFESIDSHQVCCLHTGEKLGWVQSKRFTYTGQSPLSLEHAVRHLQNSGWHKDIQHCSGEEAVLLYYDYWEDEDPPVKLSREAVISLARAFEITQEELCK